MDWTNGQSIATLEDLYKQLQDSHSFSVRYVKENETEIVKALDRAIQCLKVYREIASRNLKR